MDSGLLSLFVLFGFGAVMLVVWLLARTFGEGIAAGDELKRLNKTLDTMEKANEARRNVAGGDVPERVRQFYID